MLGVCLGNSEREFCVGEMVGGFCTSSFRNMMNPFGAHRFYEVLGLWEVQVLTALRRRVGPLKKGHLRGGSELVGII